jgi:hypothetical protein
MSGGGGAVYLGGDFDKGEMELGWPNREITGGGGAVGESEENEEKKEEESFDRSVITPKAGALLCLKGVSEGGALPFTVADPNCHVRTLGATMGGRSVSECNFFILIFIKHFL